MKKNSVMNFIKKKLIDISWIDFLGLFIFFLIMAFGAFFLLRRSEYTTLTLRLYERDGAGFWYDMPKQIYAENLKVGLVEKDQSGRVVLEITDINRTVSSDVRHDTIVKLKIKTTYNKRTGKYSYDGLPLLIGDFYTFKLQNLQLSGVVLGIGDTEPLTEQEDFIIEAYLPADNSENLTDDGVNLSKINGVKKFFADQIEEGMSIYDSNGVEIAKLIEVSKKTGSREFISNGKWVKVADYEREEVNLKIRVKASKINDSFYFQTDSPLIIGQELRLSFEKIILLPIMTNIEKINEE